MQIALACRLLKLRCAGFASPASAARAPLKMREHWYHRDDHLAVEAAIRRAFSPVDVTRLCVLALSVWLRGAHRRPRVHDELRSGHPLQNGGGAATIQALATWPRGLVALPIQGCSRTPRAKARGYTHRSDASTASPSRPRNTLLLLKGVSVPHASSPSSGRSLANRWRPGSISPLPSTSCCNGASGRGNATARTSWRASAPGCVSSSR